MAHFNSYMEDIDMDFWHRLFADNGILCHIRKGESLTTEIVGRSRQLKQAGIVKKGYFKYTITDNNGNERITGFSFCDTLVGDFISIMDNAPARTNIVAAVDSEALLCPTSLIREVLNSEPEVRIRIAEALFKQAYTTCLDIYRLSPAERYKALITRVPDILQNIPLKELASFLQITPTHLSRIRKSLTFKK